MLYLPRHRQARLRQYGPSKCGGGPAGDHLRPKYEPSVDKMISGGGTNGYTTYVIFRERFIYIYVIHTHIYIYTYICR